MKQQGHKNVGLNRTKNKHFHSSSFTWKEPRKENRAPMNLIKYSEERDEETGNGYFGARYMDHEMMTMWLSVDPMADKYPNISPYAYCAWNSMKLVDPDGEDIWEINNQGRIVNYIKDKSKDVFFLG